MSDSDDRFRLPIKSTVEISAELYLKAAEYGAKLPRPMPVDRLVEHLIINALSNQPHKQVVFQWPPPRETRSKEKR